MRSKWLSALGLVGVCALLFGGALSSSTVSAERPDHRGGRGRYDGPAVQQWLRDRHGGLVRSGWVPLYRDRRGERFGNDRSCAVGILQLRSVRSIRRLRGWTVARCRRRRR